MNVLVPGKRQGRPLVEVRSRTSQEIDPARTLVPSHVRVPLAPTILGGVIRAIDIDHINDELTEAATIWYQ